MHSFHFVLLLLCCLLVGCSKEDPGRSDDLLIQAGFQGGWGAGKLKPKIFIFVRQQYIFQLVKPKKYESSIATGTAPVVLHRL
jgi:hypothetical protein